MDHITQSRRLRQLLRICRRTIEIEHSPARKRTQADAALTALMEISISHASAVHALSGKHFEFSHSALCCARSAFEAGVVALWIGEPELPFGREGRWIGFFRGLGKFYDEQGDFLERNSPGIKDEMTAAFANTDSIFAELMKAHPEIKAVGTPNVRQILKSAGYEHLYAGYKSASQIVHSGPETVIRQRHKAESFDIFRRIGLTEWTNACIMSGWGAAVATYTALRRTGSTLANLKSLIDAHKRFNDILTKEE